MNTIIIVAAVVVVASAMPSSAPTGPRVLDANDAMYQAVINRAEKAINDANKNDLYLMKATRVLSVSLTLDSPASKVFDVEFEAIRTNSPKGADLSEVPVPAVSYYHPHTTTNDSLNVQSIYNTQNGPVSVCNVQLAYHPWLIHAVPATSVIKATCQPKSH